jgi:aryl-alcohol dehydrogenase-like predicted oxidoreductase
MRSPEVDFDVFEATTLADSDTSWRELRDAHAVAWTERNGGHWVITRHEEVAEAFTILESSSKVKYFGVSNQNPMQIELLTKFVKQKIHFNQLQLSITNTGMIDAGINVNMQIDRSVVRDGGILDSSFA